MNDDELVAGFLSRTLPSFSHESHVRVTIALLRRVDDVDALAIVREGIQSVATKSGNPAAYHETRTVAWFRIIASVRDPGDSLQVLAAHPELMRRDLLSDHYSPELLSSVRARQQFVEPDRAPLPG